MFTIRTYKQNTAPWGMVHLWEVVGPNGYRITCRNGYPLIDLALVAARTLLLDAHPDADFEHEHMAGIPFPTEPTLPRKWKSA